jgi:hypothetical protein
MDGTRRRSPVMRSSADGRASSWRKWTRASARGSNAQSHVARSTRTGMKALPFTDQQLAVLRELIASGLIGSGRISEADALDHGKAEKNSFM